MATRQSKRTALFIEPSAGRHYPIGAISAIFKADGKETGSKYAVSEWWLDAHTSGPGAHTHENEDDVFYVLEGTMTFLLGDTWRDAPRGSFVLAPAGVRHDFENRSASRAGLLNFSIPGDFEDNMPNITAWFADNPPQDTRKRKNSG